MYHSTANSTTRPNVENPLLRATRCNENIVQVIQGASRLVATKRDP